MEGRKALINEITALLTMQQEKANLRLYDCVPNCPPVLLSESVITSTFDIDIEIIYDPSQIGNYEN